MLLVASTVFACKKPLKETLAEKFFNENVLNRDFIITHANDEGNIITSQYEGYTFHLKKGADYYGGPMIVTRNGTTYTGSWKSNEDFGKLEILLPAPPTEFIFLTRHWRFTSKNLPTLKFAPWGSNAQIELTMQRQ